MTERVPKETLEADLRALRYTLAALDETERQVAGGDPAAAPTVTMTADDALTLAPALAGLVIRTMRGLAEQASLTDPAEQFALMRAFLLGELERREMSLRFADVEDEVGGGAA